MHLPELSSKRHAGLRAERLITDHPCLQTSEASKDDALEAHMQVIGSPPVVASVQPAEHDRLMERFMSGAILEVKESNGKLRSPHARARGQS